MFRIMPMVSIFCDFDGTICPQDTGQVILEHFAPGQWQEIDQAYIQGEVDSLTCLKRQLAMLPSDLPALNDFMAGFDVDPDFVSFVNLARKKGFLVSVVSDGFGLAIKPTLEKVGLGYLPVWTNKILNHNEKLRLCRPHKCLDCNRCALCKADIVKRRRQAGDYIVFVGDGASDRYAAQMSDIVFAKPELAEICQQAEVEYHPFDGFNRLIDWVENPGELFSTRDAAIECFGKEDLPK
jgi:2,3-diketo-5-methylthio-1-phosphopentane phosphatase